MAGSDWEIPFVELSFPFPRKSPPALALLGSSVEAWTMKEGSPIFNHCALACCLAYGRIPATGERSSMLHGGLRSSGMLKGASRAENRGREQASSS